MARLLMICLLAGGLMGCYPALPPDPEMMKDLYRVEKDARLVLPRRDAAVLYILTASGREHQPRIRINGDPASSSKLGQEFLVYCLTPGNYEITYEGQRFAPDKTEFVKAVAGEILVRDFFSESVIYYLPIPPLGFPLPVNYSNLKETDQAAAKELLASRRIATDKQYYDSPYRCRM